MTNPVPYYWVNPKNNRAYWRPTKSMQALGFAVRALGLHGPETEKAALEWTARWHSARDSHSARVRRGDSQPKKAREPRNARSFIYFLQIGDCIKIGVSRSPFARVRDLAGAAQGPMLKALIVPGMRRDERRLHDRFASYRINGEWFRAAAPIMALIARFAMAGEVIHCELEERTASAENLNRGAPGGVESQAAIGGLSA